MTFEVTDPVEDTMLQFGSFLFDGGELVWVGIAAIFALCTIIQLFRTVIVIGGTPSNRWRPKVHDHIWLTVVLFMLMAIGLMAAFGTANHHFDTVQARTSLEEQGFRVIDLDTKHKTATVEKDGQYAEYTLRYIDGKWRLLDGKPEVKPSPVD